MSKYNVGAYIRLSRDESYSDSDSIVNYANNKYKQNVRLKEDDIIQEIALNHYLNNPKKRYSNKLFI